MKKHKNGCRCHECWSFFTVEEGRRYARLLEGKGTSVGKVQGAVSMLARTLHKLTDRELLSARDLLKSCRGYSSPEYHNALLILVAKDPREEAARLGVPLTGNMWAAHAESLPLSFRDVLCALLCTEDITQYKGAFGYWGLVSYVFAAVEREAASRALGGGICTVPIDDDNVYAKQRGELAELYAFRMGFMVLVKAASADQLEHLEYALGSCSSPRAMTYFRDVLYREIRIRTEKSIEPLLDDSGFEGRQMQSILKYLKRLDTLLLLQLGEVVHHLWGVEDVELLTAMRFMEFWVEHYSPKKDDE